MCLVSDTTLDSKIWEWNSESRKSGKLNENSNASFKYRAKRVNATSPIFQKNCSLEIFYMEIKGVDRGNIRSDYPLW